jgi:hypothetical protein
MKRLLYSPSRSMLHPVQRTGSPLNHDIICPYLDAWALSKIAASDFFDCLRLHSSTHQASSLRWILHRMSLRLLPVVKASLRRPLGSLSNVPFAFSNQYSSMPKAKLPEPEYQFIYGAENIERYRTGGYHPVNLGDTLHGRYSIVDRLGCGGYSTIWLARDTQQDHYVALKVCIADSLPNETKVLKDLSAPSSTSSAEHPGRGSVPSILDEFTVNGPNGTHTCYTSPPARGDLREISFSQLFTPEVGRALSAGLVQALAYTHSRGYVHGGLSQSHHSCSMFL